MGRWMVFMMTFVAAVAGFFVGRFLELSGLPEDWSLRWIGFGGMAVTYLSLAAATPKATTSTSAVPGLYTPNSFAAAFERSITLPATKGPRSLIRSSICLLFSIFRTLT